MQYNNPYFQQPYQPQYNPIQSQMANLGFQLQQCLNRFVKAIANLFTKNVNTVGTYA